MNFVGVGGKSFNILTLIGQNFDDSSSSYNAFRQHSIICAIIAQED